MVEQVKPVVLPLFATAPLCGEAMRLGRSKASAGGGCARIGNAIGERAAEQQNVAAGIHCAAGHLRDGGIDFGDWPGLQIEEVREVGDRARGRAHTASLDQAGLGDGITRVPGVTAFPLSLSAMTWLLLRT